MKTQEYKKQYYYTNREKWDEWYQTNREEILKKAVERRQHNPAQYLLNECKRRAKDKDLEFNLDLSDIIIPEVCPYMGTPLVLKLGQGKRTWSNPSVDRIDSTKGYIKGNVQVVSGLANKMKSNATKEELITFAKGVLSLHEK